MRRRLCWRCNLRVPEGNECPQCGSHAFYFQSQDRRQPVKPEPPDTGPAIPARGRTMRGHGPL